MKFKVKIIYLLFLTVIIPTIILAYLSITTVKTQNILIEKELAKRAIATVSGIREESEKTFINIEQNIGDDTNNIDKTTIELKINQIVILNSGYDVILPHIPWVKQTENPALSKNFVAKYNEIESQEIKGNTEEAVVKYEQLKNNSNSEKEKAITYNALARCYNKTGRKSEAISIYKEIINKFQMEKDINGTSLASVAYIECANIFLERKQFNLAVDYSNSLLRHILYRFKCSEREALFYRDTIKNIVNSIGMSVLVGDNRMVVYNKLVSEFDTLLFLQKFAKTLKEKNLLNGINQQEYSYFVSKENIIIGYKLLKNNNMIIFSIDTSILKEMISDNIMQVLKYTQEFDYEIVDSNKNVFLSSLNVKIRFPLAEESIKQLPGWKIRLAIKESEAMQKNARIRTYVNIGTITLLFFIITISIYYIFRMINKEKELSKMKTDFVSSVSHEMRTPLTTIRMIGEMFQLDAIKDNEMRKEYYETLSGETERLTRLINKVLDFSRMDANRRPYSFLLDDIGHIVSSIVKVFEKYAEVKDYSIKLDIEKDLPEIIVDTDAISQVLINLLDNAIKYSPANKEINVLVYKKDKYIVIEVVDKGVGIEQNKIDKIFEKFYRGEDELIRETKGTGIGLSIVKHIVDAHKGKIEVKSKPGEGSKFSIFLPV